MDQTDVELANQFLDIDYLKTDAYEVTYTIEDQEYYDILTLEGWHNQTRIEGNVDSFGKQAQIPFLNFPIGGGATVGLTDVPSESINSSTGFSLSAGWGGIEDNNTTVGVDFRHLRQEINQIFPPSVFSGFMFPFNQPLPDAYTSNPGIFFEHFRPVSHNLTVNTGGRVDLVDTNAKNGAPVLPLSGYPPLNLPGTTAPPFTFDLEEALGGGDFNRSFTLGSGYLTAEYQLDDRWLAKVGGAYAMRAPTMTELYSVGTVVSVFPQQTISSLIGNPRLRSEKRFQIDVGLEADFDRLQIGGDGYYAWVTDFITFDHINPASAQFAYTQTDLATISGFEAFVEYEVARNISFFGTMSYVEGRDRTRDVNAIPAVRFRAADAQRSGFASRTEPLPMIAPMETLLGVRVHQPGESPEWGVEMTARIVANQDRIATSLSELPTVAFTVFDVRGFWQFSDSVTFIAGVENFTDATYQEHFDSHGQDIAFPLPIAPGATPMTINFGNTRDVLRPGANFYFATEITY